MTRSGAALLAAATIELERAVEWTDEYVIVDKIKAAEPLVADDPRGAPSS